MKKLLFVFIFCFFAIRTSAIEIGSFMFTPEIGVSIQKFNNFNKYHYGAYGRVWAGISDIVIAPNIRYVYMGKFDGKSVKNTQYGVLLGYNLDIFLIKFLPYIGVNYSQFSKFFDNTIAYNVGLRAKIALIPANIFLEYEHQELKSKIAITHPNLKDKLNSVRLGIGISF